MAPENVTGEHLVSKQTKDEVHFHLALYVLRERFPSGVAAVFETSDQGTYGFRWVDVLDGEDASLAAAFSDEERLSLDDRLGVHLADLDWDGVMGEDEHGYAFVQLSALREE